MRAEKLPAQLYERRLAARALGIVLEHLGMHEVVLKFNADDPQQVIPGALAGSIRFYEDGGWDEGRRALAQVDLELEGGKARVQVGRLRELLRRNHRKDFRLEDVGLVPGDELDLDMEVDLADVIHEFGEAMRVTPAQRIVSRPRGARRYRRYAGALGRGR